MTFTLEIKTAEDKATEAQEALRQTARRECRRRILEVADETAQINLASAVAAGQLSDAELASYRAGLGWLTAMRGTWARLAAAGKDPADDGNWPEVPDGVKALFARY